MQNPFENVLYTFHGCGASGAGVIRAGSIMEHGIVSPMRASLYDVKYFSRTTDLSRQRICLAISPFIHGFVGGSSFDAAVKKSISFITNWTEGTLSNLDEDTLDVRLSHAPKILPERLVGILINDIIADKKVCELPAIGRIRNLEVVCETIRHILDFLGDNGFSDECCDIRQNCARELRINAKADDSERKLFLEEKRPFIEEIDKTLGGMLQEVFDKLTGIKGATCLQCVEFYNKGILPIYTNVQELLEQAKENYERSGVRYILGKDLSLDEVLKSKKSISSLGVEEKGSII